MRVLLDESVPRQLADCLGDHEATTVPRAGWAGFRNGELMLKTAAEFDVSITADKGIEFQQNYADLDLGILVLVAPNNRVETILGMADAILRSIGELRPGQLIRVSA